MIDLKKICYDPNFEIDYSKQSTVSYSQLEKWGACPNRWKLRYIDKIKEEPTIHLVVGTAVHSVIEYYTYLYYKSTKTELSSCDTPKIFLEELKGEYIKQLESNKGVHFTTPEEFQAGYASGVRILKNFQQFPNDYFKPKSEMELVGIEVPVFMKFNEKYDVWFIGYIDLLLRDKKTGEYLVIDFKTANRGWTSYHKSNKIKRSQVLLYKSAVSKMFNAPLDEIDVQYIILRKEYDGVGSIYQKYSPKSGESAVAEAVEAMSNFIKVCFREDGTKSERPHGAISGEGGSNCKFCPYESQHKLCPPRERIDVVNDLVYGSYSWEN